MLLVLVLVLVVPLEVSPSPAIRVIIATAALISPPRANPSNCLHGINTNDHQLETVTTNITLHCDIFYPNSLLAFIDLQVIIHHVG